MTKCAHCGTATRFHANGVPKCPGSCDGRFGSVSAAHIELSGRLAKLKQASQAIRAEAALTVCKSSEVRIASRKLRMETRRITNSIEASLQGRSAPQIRRRLRMARAIAEALSRAGYYSFVAVEPQETASLQ